MENILEICLICGQLASNEMRLRRHMEGKIRKKLSHHPNYGGHEISPEKLIKLLSESRLLNAKIDNGFRDIIEKITVGNEKMTIVRVVSHDRLNVKLFNLWNSQNNISIYKLEIPATEENDGYYFYEWILPESIPLQEAVRCGYITGEKGR